MQAADTLKCSIENPESRIDVLTSNVLQSRIAENRHILRQIVRAILFLSKQGLSLRGNNEDIRSSQNPGNILALLKVFAEQDDILHTHLYQPKWKNATYLSPWSHNEIIGNDIIRAKIISEIIETKFFSILADKVISHNVEHLALCVHFVDAICDIREEFVAFVILQSPSI